MPGYTYDATLGRYRDSGGRLVADATVRAALDTEIQSLDAQARALADDLRAGRISLDAWQDGMRALARQARLLGAIAAKGGRDAMTAADFGRVGQQLRSDYNFIGGFAGEVAAGFQPLDGTLTTRAVLYARNARVSFEAQRGAEQLLRAKTLEHSVLHPADHCDDCLAEAAKGWQPIGTLIPIGQRQCRSNDQCTMAYR